jgi:hypothetical protein
VLTAHPFRDSICNMIGTSIILNRERIDKNRDRDRKKVRLIDKERKTEART